MVVALLYGTGINFGHLTSLFSLLLSMSYLNILLVLIHYRLNRNFFYHSQERSLNKESIILLLAYIFYINFVIEKEIHQSDIKAQSYYD